MLQEYFHLPSMQKSISLQSACFQQQPASFWITTFSDLLIFAIFFSVSARYVYLPYKHQSLPDKSLYTLLALSLFACIAINFLVAVNIWPPLFKIAVSIKLIFVITSMLAILTYWFAKSRNSLIPGFKVITQQVKQESWELKLSQNRLQHIIELSPSVFYILLPTKHPDSPYKVEFISEKIFDLTGFTPEEWYRNETLWIDHVHMADADRVLKNMQLLRKKGKITHEYRFKCKNGNYRWIRDELILESGVKGDIGAVYGSWDDVTDYKRTESELKLAAITFESMQAVMITDAAGNILRINKAFSDITGYQVEDVIGKNPKIFKSGHQDDNFYQQFWQSLLQDGKFEGELWNRKKNGEVFPTWESVTAVKNDQGEITHFVSLFSNISEWKEKELEIQTLAYYDALTRLPNRRLLTDRIEHELHAAKRYRLFGVIIFLDLDDFKELNDSLGHRVGDELLIKVSERISRNLRSEDTPARLGGDEFVILLQAHDASAEEASENALVVVDKIRRELNKPYLLNGIPMSFTSSIGVSIYPDNNLTADDLLQQADAAMYRSKRRGKNSFSFFDRAMQDAADHRIIIEKQISTGLRENQFELFFQPQIELATQSIGAEALIRWRHPQRGTLSPADFLEIAHQSELVSMLDSWVIDAACRQLKKWQHISLPLRYLTINVSAKLFAKAAFVEQVEKLLKETGVHPDSLIFEISENLIADKLESSAGTIKRLNAHGIRFSLDDYGKGHSSLASLKQIPIHQLKIDQEFVQGMLNDNGDEAIVDMLIAIANKLNIQSIGKGVETQQQFTLLRDKGCDGIQGYLFSRPLAEQALVDFIRRQNSGLNQDWQQLQ